MKVHVKRKLFKGKIYSFGISFPCLIEIECYLIWIWQKSKYIDQEAKGKNLRKKLYNSFKSSIQENRHFGFIIHALQHSLLEDIDKSYRYQK